MIKILKAIKKHKTIERRFKSTQYHYNWQPVEGVHLDFQQWDYRIKK